MKRRLKLRIWSMVVPAWFSAAAIGQTNIYHAFPDSNAVWVGHRWPGLINCGEHYAYTISGDTLIGGQTYHTLVIPYVNAYGMCTVYHTPGYAGGFRQDLGTRKVFWIAPGTTAEELLYDFELGVGDTINGFDRLGCIQPNCVITLMDSVLIGTTYRKQWHCGEFPSTNVLIEGIGFISGVLEGCATGMPDGPFNVLDCFSQDGVTLFSNGTDNCDVQTAVPQLTDRTFRTIIYPDPFFDRATVRFDRDLVNATLVVLDPVGRAVRTVEHVSGDHLILQRDGLAAGCYSVVLVGGAQRSSAARMVLADR
jgi:hypothetical protein